MATRTERIQSGKRMVLTREIPAETETVWELLTDTEQWPAWGPSVSDVDTEQRYIETGTTGRLRLPFGLWIPFEITHCNDHRWEWNVARLPATGHRVEPTENGCRVGLELPLYGGPYIPVCLRALDQIEELAATNTTER